MVGTRPEAIKMAPVYLRLRAGAALRPLLAASGQHRDLVEPALADFGLVPDQTLKTMAPGQGLAELSARLFTAVDALLAREKPAAVLVQGDTTTVLVTAQAAFYRGVPVGHVEAGLRSGDLADPFPEEMNRRAVSLVASWHFAPTGAARRNLLAEGVADDRIAVTGNPVVDALRFLRPGLTPENAPLPPEVETICGQGRRAVLLVTCHRRENIARLPDIGRALIRLTESRADLAAVLPVHPNPEVGETLRRLLGGRPGVVLIPPLAYRSFLRLMDACDLILTDSGGLQEEGPAFGKPVLVMRRKTERPEGLEAGVCRLVGVDSAAIEAAVGELLDSSAARAGMVHSDNPFGDGRAADRIADFLTARLATPKGAV